MKYYLTIILTISSLLIAQDTPQVPGWGVYFGGALNSASIDPLNDGFDIDDECMIPYAIPLNKYNGYIRIFHQVTKERNLTSTIFEYYQRIKYILYFKKNWLY